MICFRDMTFCNAPVHTPDCLRALTPDVKAAAGAWWQAGGGRPEDAPIAVSDFCTARLAPDPES